MSTSRRTDRLVRVNTDPDRRTLNRFGFVWLGFFTLFGALALIRAGAPTVAVGLWIAALAVPLAGWLWPPVMRAVFVGLSWISYPIGWLVSHVVLALVYFLIVTPIGLGLRVAGRNPLERSFDERAETYWVERGGGRPPSRYVRQF